MKQHKKTFRVNVRRIARRNNFADTRLITHYLLCPKRRARAYAIVYPAAKEFAEAMSKHTGKIITAREIMSQFPFKR